MPPSATETVDVFGDSTNEEILAWVSEAGGTGEFLREVFLGMQDAFLADRAGNSTATVQWLIGSPEGQLPYQMHVHDGRCEVRPGRATDPGVTFEMALPDFLRLVLGGVDGDTAYQTGALRVSGNADLAQTVNGWFRPPIGAR